MGGSSEVTLSVIRCSGVTNVMGVWKQGGDETQGTGLQDGEEGDSVAVKSHQ